MRRVLLFFGWLFWLIPARADELRLVQFSDVHASGPYYSQEAFAEACRAGFKLRPQGILLTGDHGDNSQRPESFDRRFAEAVGLWKEPLKEYPGAVFLALGNDDFGQNYQSEPQDLRQTYYTCLEAFGSRYYLDELGNGESPERLGGFRWLTLNSQLFSPLNHTPQAPEQARVTLQWLRRTLALSRSQATPVMLLSHIAPVWDLYSRSPAWHPGYLRQLQDILHDYPGQVMIFSGHHHRNHLQALARVSQPVPILTAGALATKYGYRSNWREYCWQIRPGASVESVGYTLHYPSQVEWRSSYQFQPARVGDFLQALMGDREFYARYLLDVFGRHHDAYRWVSDEGVREAIAEEFWVKSR